MDKKNQTTEEYDLAVVMPCLNEERTLETCILKTKKGIENSGVRGVIIIADNGSTDNSLAIAKKHNTQIVHVKNKGYGSALRGGIDAAKTKYIIMGDTDDSHDLANIKPFVDKLKQGYDLVVGNRFKGGVDKGTMTFMHRYIGNPILSFIARILFTSKIRDYHCGLRGFSKKAYEKMNLHTTGMEFASEMIVKATLNNLNITEVPTKVKKDGRDRAPHLNTWSDGWRHLKFLLIFAPEWLYLIPGVSCLIIGISFFLISFFNIPIISVQWGLHTVTMSSCFTIVSIQFLSTYHLTKLFKYNLNLYSKVRKTYLLEKLSINHGIFIGLFFALIGLGIFIGEFIYFYGLPADIKTLSIDFTMRFLILAFTIFIVGIQLIINSFFAGILNLKVR